MGRRTAAKTNRRQSFDPTALGNILAIAMVAPAFWHTPKRWSPANEKPGCFTAKNTIKSFVKVTTVVTSGTRSTRTLARIVLTL